MASKQKEHISGVGLVNLIEGHRQVMRPDVFKRMLEEMFNVPNGDEV